MFYQNFWPQNVAFLLYATSHSIPAMISGFLYIWILKKIGSDSDFIASAWCFHLNVLKHWSILAFTKIKSSLVYWTIFLTAPLTVELKGSMFCMLLVLLESIYSLGATLQAYQCQQTFKSLTASTWPFMVTLQKCMLLILCRKLDCSLNILWETSVQCLFLLKKFSAAQTKFPDIIMTSCLCLLELFNISSAACNWFSRSYGSGKEY